MPRGLTSLAADGGWCAQEPPRLKRIPFGIAGATRGMGQTMKTKRRIATQRRSVGAPFLRRITSLPEKTDQTKFPFNIRAFSQGIDLVLRSKVAFFVGENVAVSPRCWKRSRSAAASIPRAGTAITTARCSQTGHRSHRPSGCRGCRRSPRGSSCARRAFTTSRRTSRRYRICGHMEGGRCTRNRMESRSSPSLPTALSRGSTFSTSQRLRFRRDLRG
jgi:hypothetical protein